MPGLLCFVIDGLHTETLASVRTPHLDRLGRRGASCGRLLAPPPALTLPALMVAGAGWVLTLSSFNVTVQMSVPRWVVARALALYQMAAFLKTLGIKTAYNLDGGGSSTMYFNGSVVNKPTTTGRNISERSVSDIVSIGY